MNLGVIFLTGLTSGGISCLAMQGGLLAGLISNQKQTNSETKDWKMVAMFLVSKLVVHTLFGLALGGLGAVISLSLGVRLAFQMFAAIFMLATAMNLLQVHPIFRFVSLQPPKFMQKWVRNAGKNQGLFAPALLGALTLFVPCGVTQAMEVVAIGSGSPAIGALTMAAFVLGTWPLFATVGIATSKLSENKQKYFVKTAAAVLVFLAIYSFNGVLTVLDSPITAGKTILAIRNLVSTKKTSTETVGVNLEDGVQKVTIQVTNSGYSPRLVKVVAGKPVELSVQTTGTYSCAAAFTLKAYKISAFLSPDETRVFKFTPTEKGAYTFTCSMGMYTGTFEVI